MPDHLRGALHDHGKPMSPVNLETWLYANWPLVLLFLILFMGLVALERGVHRRLDAITGQRKPDSSQ